jgi:hypothetical protein
MAPGESFDDRKAELLRKLGCGVPPETDIPPE